MKTPMIHAYLNFGGRCEEALDFYKAALGGKVATLLRFNESPEPPPPGRIPPGFENKVMHAELHIGEAMLMASDGCSEGANFQGFSLSLSFPTTDEVDRAFAALSKGGEVRMPLGKTFFSPRFGMVVDRFGVSWILIQPGETPK